MLYLLYASIEIALERMSNIGGTISIFITLAILVVVCLMLWRILYITKRPKLDIT